MEFKEFVRRPFTIEAVQITDDNIQELAEFVGTLRMKDDGSSYIQVDRRLVPNLDRVYPGFWMTRMGGNIRCYSKKVFLNQFVESTPDIMHWVDWMAEQVKTSQELPQPEAETSEGVPVNVFTEENSTTVLPDIPVTYSEQKDPREAYRTE